MPNIIFTGDLNFPIIDRQMEIADGGTLENQVQPIAFLKCAQEQCSRQYIGEPIIIIIIIQLLLFNYYYSIIIIQLLLFN